MKILYILIAVFVLCLISIEQTPANVTLDGTCIERCLNNEHTIDYCRVECTKFN